MLWFYLAIAACLIFAAQELLMRVLSIRAGSPRVFSFVFNAWGALFAIAVFIAEKGSFRQLAHLTPIQISLILTAIVLYGIYERSQFVARRGIDAATFSIIMKINTVISFVGAIVFLGEPMTLNKTFGVTLIIAAGLLLVYKNPKFRISESFLYTLLCALALGTVGFVDKPASAPVPPALYSFLVWCAPLAIIAFPGIRIRDVRKEFKIGSWKVAAAALLNVVGYIIYLKALTLADASRVNPIVATSGILTVLGGIIVLRERDHFLRKILAGFIAFAGVILLK